MGGRSRHFGCCGMAVPDYADRSRMYPQLNGPSQQTMNPNPMATYNMANGMPPMARPMGQYGQQHPAASTIQNGWRRQYAPPSANTIRVPNNLLVHPKANSVSDNCCGAYELS